MSAVRIRNGSFRKNLIGLASGSGYTDDCCYGHANPGREFTRTVTAVGVAVSNPFLGSDTDSSRKKNHCGKLSVLS